MAEELWQYEPKRPVEWLATYLMIFGIIPSSAWGRMYAAPPDAYKRGQHLIARGDWMEGISARQGGHPGWHTCPNCGKDYPDNSDYETNWHSNGYRPGGDRRYHSICKYCRCADERAQYQRRRSS